MGILLGNPCLRRTSPEGVRQMASMQNSASFNPDDDAKSWGADGSMAWLVFWLVILGFIGIAVLFWPLPMFW